MSRAPPPSHSAPPVSRDVVDIVKRKIAPPSNPPPAGMTINFHAPKVYKKKTDRRDDRDRRDNYHDDRDSDHDNEYDNYRGRDGDRDDGRVRDRDYDRGHDRDYDRDGDYDRDRERGRDNRDHRDNRDGYYDEEGDDYYDSQDEHYDDHGDYDDRNHDRNRDYDRHQDRGRDYDNRNRDHDRDRDRPRVDYQADTKDMGRGKGPGYRDVKEEQSSKPDAPPSSSAAPPLTVSKPQSNAASPSSSALGSQPPTTTLHNRLTIFNFQPILRSTYRELRAFVTSPCAGGITTRCYIERNRSGSKMLAPYFSLCADLEDGTGRELMVCRKVLQSRSAHYIFSLKAEDLWRKREQRSRLYLGKLRATSTNDYVLYDNGICAAPDESEELLQDLERGVVVGGVVWQPRCP
ncbi:hypothetical protein EON64_03500 [archaeon]|nr:MAG: hypothetical protein EON64_03500 [archaeon]